MRGAFIAICGAMVSNISLVCFMGDGMAVWLSAVGLLIALTGLTIAVTDYQRTKRRYERW